MSFSLIICRSIWRGYHYNVMRPGARIARVRMFLLPQPGRIQAQPEVEGKGQPLVENGT